VWKVLLICCQCIVLLVLKCETCQISYIHPFQKNVVNVKCNWWVMDLAIFKALNLTQMQMLIVQEMRKFTNPFKYKCETLCCYVCFNIY